MLHPTKDKAISYIDSWINLKQEPDGSTWNKNQISLQSTLEYRIINEIDTISQPYHRQPEVRQLVAPEKYQQSKLSVHIRHNNTNHFRNKNQQLFNKLKD